MLKLMMVVSLTIQMSNNKPNKLKVLKALTALELRLCFSLFEVCFKQQKLILCKLMQFRDGKKHGSKQGKIHRSRI